MRAKPWKYLPQVDHPHRPISLLALIQQIIDNHCFSNLDCFRRCQLELSNYCFRLNNEDISTHSTGSRR